MKTINKIMLFIFACLTLSNLTTYSFFYNGRPSNALTGAAIGGLAGGRKGAGIGLGVGMATDIIGAAAARDDRPYYDDYDREPQSLKRSRENDYNREPRPSKRARKERERDLEDEIERLHEELEFERSNRNRLGE